MKNIFLITTLLIATIGMNSCKDKCPEPKQLRIESLFGYWCSVDSVKQGLPQGGFIYVRDTILINRRHVVTGSDVSDVLNILEYNSYHYEILSWDSDDKMRFEYRGPVIFGKWDEINFLISLNESNREFTVTGNHFFKTSGVFRRFIKY
jgi:hypothetical protein